MRITEQQRDIETAREARWLASFEAGMTVVEIAKAEGLSPVWIRERLRRARLTRSLLESCCSSSSDIPRLELSSGVNPQECLHFRTSTRSGERVVYCLTCDAISTDGGLRWLAAQSPETPSLAVLAPQGTGRGERLQRLTAGSQGDPGGPTSYRPNPSLKGGRGRTGSS